MNLKTLVVESKSDLLEKSDIYVYPGEAFFARNEPLMLPDESNVVLGERLIELLTEIEAGDCIAKINSSPVKHKKIVLESIEKCQELLFSRSFEIKQNFILDHNVINLRNLLSENRRLVANANQDLGLTQFFEILGNDVLNLFSIIIEDPLLINGFGIYFLSIFYLKIWKRIVLRKDLSIQNLSNIFLGSLKNAKIRLSQLTVRYPSGFIWLMNCFQLFYRGKHFLIRRYTYDKRLNFFFFRDLSFVGVVSYGINKMTKLFNKSS